MISQPKKAPLSGPLSYGTILFSINNAFRWAEKGTLLPPLQFLLFFSLPFTKAWKHWIANYFYLAYRKISLSSWSKQIRQIMAD